VPTVGCAEGAGIASYSSDIPKLKLGGLQATLFL